MTYRGTETDRFPSLYLYGVSLERLDGKCNVSNLYFPSRYKLAPFLKTHYILPRVQEHENRNAAAFTSILTNPFHPIIPHFRISRSKSHGNGHEHLLTEMSIETSLSYMDPTPEN